MYRIMEIKTITLEELEKVYKTMSQKQAIEYLGVSLGTYYKHLHANGLLKKRQRLVVKKD